MFQVGSNSLRGPTERRYITECLGPTKIEPEYGEYCEPKIPLASLPFFVNLSIDGLEFTKWVLIMFNEEKCRVTGLVQWLLTD